MKIGYLNAEASADLIFERIELMGGEPTTPFEIAMINHSELEVFTLKDFVEAFNDEYISDLGYIILLED